MEIEDIIQREMKNCKEDVLNKFMEEFVNSAGSPEIQPTSKEIEKMAKYLFKKYKIHPSKLQMRVSYEKNFKKISINSDLKRYFIKNVVRSESGVLVVTIVTKPGENIKFSCPEKCAYCPTETNREGIPTQPKSYISTEPAMMRATQNKFDIGDQIRDRIKSYFYTGNITKDEKKKKMEVILSGGTWDVMPKIYRDQVINEIYYTFNTYVESNKRPMLSIEEEKKLNETSLFGVIGLTIETRPDYVTKRTLIEYLEYGVTRVQLGGQSTHDDILRKIKRGCTKKNMIQAIRLLKGVGMKVVTHWMPDLPGSSPQRDTQMFDELLENSDLQSDDWKVYPCAVIKSESEDLIITSDIHEWYENGSYMPYAEKNVEDLIDVCIKFKTKINPWIRIERLVRDIPMRSINVGYSRVTHLRDVIKERMKKMDATCKCIRCMEIRDRTHLLNEGKVVVRKYSASQGTEYHISYEIETRFWHLGYIWFCTLYVICKIFRKTIYYEGNMKLYSGLFGFLRLRIDKNPGLNIVDELQGCGLIREVHVYGLSTSVGLKNESSSQHKGVGQILVKTAEDIIRQVGLKKSAVIAGTGAREYYKNKCGYNVGKYYMIKNL
jgi:ELP3 family radical SAM enzyme/protein acetyltransferase